MSVFYHTTTEPAAEQIMRGGFRDGEGSYGFASITVSGVFISADPVDINEGAQGGTVIEVTLPDHLDLSDYAVQEEGRPVWEWIVPAAILNAQGTFCLKSLDDFSA